MKIIFQFISIQAMFISKKIHLIFFLGILILSISSIHCSTSANNVIFDKAVKDTTNLRQSPTDSLSTQLSNKLCYRLPNFSLYPVKERRKAFFKFLSPIIKYEIQKLLNERSRIIRIFKKQKTDSTLSKSEIEFLTEKSIEVRVKDFESTNLEQCQELLKKFDYIPESLCLVQASNESGNGTSRFARVANNIFGEWCFTPDCGIIPLRRINGMEHEIKKYETINASIRGYMINLNKRTPFKPLRDIRWQLRQAGEKITGLALADGLYNYSAHGNDYINNIKKSIKNYNLE